MSLGNLPHLVYEVGAGQVQSDGDGVRLLLPATDGSAYHDAQLDDYHVDGHMRWRPPVRMTVRARFSHPQGGWVGTAGFGFWNDPFGMTQFDDKRWLPRLRLPQALWYFMASPPSNMALAQGVPGFGWKAATIDASAARVKALLPLAPLAMLACRMPWVYRKLWPIAQRLLKIEEMLLPTPMEEWHDYCLMWKYGSAQFAVDGEEIFLTRSSPRGPLGFVAWVDNQFLVATPQGKMKSGVVATGEQWMEIASLEVVAG